MNSALHRAVVSFYNLIYDDQAFASSMGKIDVADQERYYGRAEGLNWVLDRCQELEDVDQNLTAASLQKLLSDVKSDLEHELSVQRREKGRRADGREEALLFVNEYLTSLITATEIELAKSPV
ncbi:MAG: hypothetical protein D6690_03770 [Nitrospirae bacterium]|nr:MAG: hypothetical protein D6690_03770 [Nitrospirota bacterium]